MEYYGKILCISAIDLTYDDRPRIIDGRQDYSHSRTLQGWNQDVFAGGTRPDYV